jgi:sugar/nucleoside kinase (ribokinase family)
MAREKNPAKDITLSEDDERILDKIWADTGKRKSGEEQTPERKKDRKDRNGLILAMGGIATDILVSPKTEPKPGTDVPAIIQARPGGTASNFAFWCSLLGQESGLVGAIGRDALADIALSDLNEAGVSVLVESHQNLMTACIINLVGPSGEKSFITQRGADEAIPPEIITERLMAKAKWLHIGGYMLYSDVSRPAAEEAIRLALAGGVPISIDPSSWYPLEEYGVSRFLSHARNSTLLMPNYEEGMILVGRKPPEEMAVELLDYASHVVVKLGQDGCVIAKEGYVQVCPTEAVEDPVDTTGAGDCFDAAFVCEFLREGDMWSAACFANSLAGKVVTTIGARPDVSIARGWVKSLEQDMRKKEHPV